MAELVQENEADEFVWAVESDCFQDVFVALERGRSALLGYISVYDIYLLGEKRDF